MYYHACGQPVVLGDTHVGYCSFYLTLVDGEPVRYCPRCGKRIWVETLIYSHSPPVPVEDEWLAAYLDQQDTLRCLEAVL